MAILKGFPPNNNLFGSPPKSPHTCELCGGSFYCSHPLGLNLRVKGWQNYNFLPCQACWKIDQGSGYWTSDLNHWGDRFYFYSKARYGLTIQQIVNTPSMNDHCEPVRLFMKDTTGDTAEWLYTRCNDKLTGFWCGWRLTGSSEVNTPKNLILMANQRIASFFLNSQYYKYGAYRRDGWSWRIEVDDVIPDSVSSVFFIEDKTLITCNII